MQARRVGQLARMRERGAEKEQARSTENGHRARDQRQADRPSARVIRALGELWLPTGPNQSPKAVRLSPQVQAALSVQEPQYPPSMRPKVKQAAAWLSCAVAVFIRGKLNFEQEHQKPRKKMFLKYGAVIVANASEIVESSWFVFAVTFFVGGSKPGAHRPQS